MRRKRKKSALDVAREIADGGVSSVSGAGRSISNLPIRDLIELDKYEKQEEAMEDPANAIGYIRSNPQTTRF